MTAVARSLFPSVVERTGDAKFLANGTVDDHERDPRRCRRIGCGRAVQQELRPQHRGDRGEHDGKMHRQATGHDGIDREFFRRDRHSAHRLDADELLRRCHGPVEAGCNGVFGGWNDGQAVGPAVRVIQLLNSPDVFHIIGPRGELHGYDRAENGGKRRRSGC